MWGDQQTGNASVYKLDLTNGGDTSGDNNSGLSKRFNFNVVLWPTADNAAEGKFYAGDYKSVMVATVTYNVAANTGGSQG